jgi:hypothetical protein
MTKSNVFGSERRIKPSLLGARLVSCTTINDVVRKRDLGQVQLPMTFGPKKASRQSIEVN